MDIKGAGILLITNQRLVFDAFEHDPNWTRTWKTILGWDYALDQLIVETTSGNPTVFDFQAANRRADFVDGDPRCLAAVMENACPHTGAEV